MGRAVKFKYLSSARKNKAALFWVMLVITRPTGIQEVGLDCKGPFFRSGFPRMCCPATVLTRLFFHYED